MGQLHMGPTRQSDALSLDSRKKAAGLMFSVGKRVEVSFDLERYRDTWFPATILGDFGNGSFVVEYQRVDAAAPLKETVDFLRIRPCPPHLKDKNFVLLERVDAYYDFGWRTGVISKALADCRYIVFFKHTNTEMEFSHTDLRPHMEWKDGKWFTSSQKRKRIKTSDEDDNPTSGSGRSSSSSRKLQVKGPPNSVGSMEGGNAVVDVFEGVQEECMTAETNLPVVLGLECDKSSNSCARKPCLSGGEELSKLPDNHAALVDNELSSIKDSNQLDSEEKIPKRRRGRPRKVVTNSSITSASEDPRKEVIVDELLIKDCIISENDSLQDVEVKSAMMDSSVPGQECLINGSGKNIIRNQERQKNKTGSTVIVSALRKLSEEVVEASTKQQDRHSSKRGRRRTVNLNSVSQVQDSPHASGGKAAGSSCMTEELEKFIEELPTNTFEDQPLSKWFQEMHSPTTNDASRLSPARIIEQCVVASNGQLETVMENHAVDKRKIVGSELQNLPFVKNTLLWSTLESMEVFQKLPQKPHFRPLEQCKESSREGLAIGCMVNFSSVVERTSRLQFNDPKSNIDDILETVLELESHGFDVQVVRDRITHLMKMKDKQEKLQEQIEQLHGEINKHNLEKTKLDEEEDEINKQMKYLQGKLSQVASVKEAKDREIASLQSKLEGIKKGIRSVQNYFEGLDTLV